VELLQAGLQSIAPGVRVTIDPLEFRGFRYHTGIAVTVFAPGRHEELGRGGRYLTSDGEAATGLTLYADAVLRAAPSPAAGARLLVPFGTPAEATRAFRAEGFATVAALDPDEEPAAAARRLGCSHVLQGKQVKDVLF